MFLHIDKNKTKIFHATSDNVITGLRSTDGTYVIFTVDKEQKRKKKAWSSHRELHCLHARSSGLLFACAGVSRTVSSSIRPAASDQKLSTLHHREIWNIVDPLFLCCNPCHRGHGRPPQDCYQGRRGKLPSVHPEVHQVFKQSWISPLDRKSVV